MIDLNRFAEDLPTDDLIGDLFELGHFHVQDSDGFRGAGPDSIDDVLGEHRASLVVYNAVKSFQSWRGLKDDGRFGGLSLGHRLTEQPFRCACPDIMERRAEESQFPDSCKAKLKVAFKGWEGRRDWDALSYPRERAWTFRNAVNKAMRFWNELCGINIEVVPWSAREEAHVTIDAKRLSGSTLAWMELAINRCDITLNGRFNTSVDWAWFLLWTTLAHELGHAWGLPHLRIGNVMYFSHDPNYNGQPGPEETREMIQRYGKPATKPPPDEPPTDPRFITIPKAIEPGEYQLIKVLDYG